MLKLVCNSDGFYVEESSLIIQNLGLPEDFTRHFLKQHQKPDPQEDIDYQTIEVLTTQ